MSVQERRALEGEVVRKCLARTDKQVWSGPATTLLRMLVCCSCHQELLSDHSAWGRTLQCNFLEHRNYRIVYRRYASLFFLVGVDGDEVWLAC